MPIFRFPGRRGNSFIYHQGDGFHYHRNRVRPTRRFVYLRCVFSGGMHQCPGTAKMLPNRNIFTPLRGHSHFADPLYLDKLSLKREIFRRLKAGDQTPYSDIIQQEGQNYSLEVRAQVPLGSIISRMDAIRSQQRPPVPADLEVFGAYLLLPQYQYLTRCLQVPDSLFAGSCGSLADQNLSLVFISPEMQTFMQTRRMIFADGTSRKLFRKPKASQIFVISAAWRYHAIVMCRSIMLRRTQAAYEVLFEYLLTLMPDFNPSSIKTDFEEAQINAWQTCFPGTRVEGCLWHYNVAVYTMAKKKLGLHHLVQEEEEVASIVRSAGALPLLPAHDIQAGLIDLGEEAEQQGWIRQLRDFFRYMQRVWVPKAPCFSVNNSVHRTNNISESSNRTLNKAIRGSNPGVFDVLRAFVVTNEKYTVDLQTLAMNLQPGRGRKISALANDARIHQLTTDYMNGDISRLDFLHRASRKFQGVFNQIYN